MKIRTDYVSNSSSSSFVLWGTRIEHDEMLSIAGLKNEHGNSAAELLDDAYFALDGEFGKVICDYNDDCIYCGESPAKMKDDETLKDFKSAIVTQLAKLGIARKPSDIEFLSGIDQDGEICFD